MPSCLPFMLLGSGPLNLQADVTDPGFSDLAREQRCAIDVTHRDVAIDIQPSRVPTRAPVYRRFSTYEQRIRSRSADLSVVCHGSYDMRKTGRTARSKSAPIPLEIPDIHNKWIKVQQGEKSKGKKRATDPVEPTGIDDDHVAPFPLRSVSRRPSATSTSSYASSSKSASRPRLGSHSSAFPSSPQLYTLKEDEEYSTPTSSAIDLKLPPPLFIARKDDTAEAVSLSTTVPSPCSSKRVSFSPVTDKVMHYPDQNHESSSSVQQSSWGGFLLPNKSRTIVRPPLARLSSLPSVRGQAAGRSILKRTTSMIDCTSNLDPDLPSVGVPIYDKLSIPSLRQSSNKVPPINGGGFIDCIAVVEMTTFEDVDLSDAHPAAELKQQSAMFLTSRSKAPSAALTEDKRAVRHWSMEGTNWFRRSGVYVSGLMSKMGSAP